MIKKNIFITFILFVSLAQGFTDGNEEKKKGSETKTELEKQTQDNGKANSDKKGNADVVFIQAEEQSNGTWTFHATVKHPE
ncbi:MAG: hypothetical protein J7K04_01960 [Spirochaetales bacterium]|nr:hypothetical protein [Spirochaetales bacterium]